MTEAVSRPGPVAPTDGELLELAVRVAGAAKSGEELEVYVSRGVETDVRAYEGEVESMSSAASAGVGIRVVVGGRQGFAYAGTLEEGVLRQTLADAVTTPPSPPPTNMSAWPSPTASHRHRSTFGTTR